MENQTDLYLSMHYYETNASMLSKNAKQEMSISQLLRLEPWSRRESTYASGKKKGQVESQQEHGHYSSWKKIREKEVNQESLTIH